MPLLILARVIQGIATGAAVGAIGAGMLDVDKAKGAIANSVAAPIGTAVGAVASGVLVQYLPFRTHLVYLVLLGVFVIQGVGVAFMRETSSARPGALASLRVQLALPRASAVRSCSPPRPWWPRGRSPVSTARSVRRSSTC